MRAACLFAALPLLSLLAGCGFTPMYANPHTVAGLSAIEVQEPKGRLGRLLHEDLDDALGRDKAAKAAYRLELAVDQTRGARGLSLQDVSRYYDVALAVHYTLRSTADGKVVDSGDVSSQVSYDDSGRPYADIQADQDAQERLAADAARRIQVRLGAWFAHQTPTP